MAATFEMADPRLRRAARIAYERGRFEGALWRSAAVTALLTPAFLVCNRTPVAAACLLGFGLVLLAARIVGRDFDRGARAGALAGVLPCLLPTAIRAWNPELCASMFHNGAWFCGIGGAAAGVILGLRSRASHGLSFWASALAALGLAASLGCIP
ncbi:MAG TPA: hypothetical protein VJA66_05125, partial [Thermoanaerobaculia bacterium]